MRRWRRWRDRPRTLADLLARNLAAATEDRMTPPVDLIQILMGES